jgi:hypothetical protein
MKREEEEMIIRLNSTPKIFAIVFIVLLLGAIMIGDKFETREGNWIYIACLAVLAGVLTYGFNLLDKKKG